jgi:NADH dehydrogenase [ubiquinone] 1 alpha subcomplex assembly factor 6
MTVHIPASLSYLEQEARRTDKDRFLCSLFAPHHKREALCALLVMNQEIARIPELVTDPLLQRIRLQWWRDELHGLLEGRSSAHPALAALAPAARSCELPPASLDRYLDARESELDFDQPPNQAALERFGESTSGVVGEMSVRLLGDASPAALDASRRVGTAWALIGLARSVPHHLQAGRCYLPLEVCRQHGVATEDLLAGRRPAGLARVVETVVLRAQALLRELRSRRGGVPCKAVPALLPAVLADGYARTLRRCSYDPFVAPVESAGAIGLLRLAVAGRLGRY